MATDSQKTRRLKRLWQKIANKFKPTPGAEALREMVEELIDDPKATPGLLPSERTLLSNIMKLRSRRAGDCMVPRADIVALEISVSLRELAEEMATNEYSRIPIYRETLDDVIGMAHVKDVLPFLVHQKPCVIADILRPVLYVAPSMPVSKLLLQMRQTRQHMAVVIDEFGGVDGLITIEDVVEEIVGEIEDEHDLPEPTPVIVRGDGTLLVDARLPVETFEAQTKIDLPVLEGEEVDTLGGYVAHLAGRVPPVGEIVSGPAGLSFEILEKEQSRINRLRIRTPKRQENKNAGQGGNNPQ